MEFVSETIDVIVHDHSILLKLSRSHSKIGTGEKMLILVEKFNRIEITGESYRIVV